MSALLYFLLIKPLSLLPLPVLYFFSDLLYVLLYRIMGYRKKVVETNLRKAFPDKTSQDIELIMRRFYHHFCDLIAESIRLFSISEAEAVRRCRVKKPEVLNDLFQEGRSILLLAGHYNNWELAAAAFDPQVLHHCVGIYQPLRNAFFDKKMQQSRSKFGLELVSKNDTRSFFEENRQRLTATMFGVDQSPTFSKKVYWTSFLNQETAVAFGAEKYAKAYNYPPVFCRIQRVRRGYYEIDLEVITTDPVNTAHGEITEKHTALLEAQILENPAYWLWTHKRWKRKKEESATG